MKMRQIFLALLLMVGIPCAFASEWKTLDELIAEDEAPTSSAPAASAGTVAATPGSFQDFVARHNGAVALVVVAYPNGVREPMGTAWGYKPGKFATNGHISLPVEQLLRKGARVQVQLNNSQRAIYNIEKAVTHPAYNAQIASFDVGMLHVKQTDHPILPTASKAALQGISAGQEVALMGFPMEQLRGNNINVNKPLASVQIGNIVALSDYSLKDAGFDNNYAIRHSIPSAGGASGSPIFNKAGVVVGVHNAGNYWTSVELVPDGKDKIKMVPKRRALASLINFGVRVDLLEDLL